MEELLMCPWKQFVEEIGKISNSQELQKILWQLEEEDLKSQEEKIKKGKFTFGDTKGIDEAKISDPSKIIEARMKTKEARKAFAEFPNKLLIKRKIQFCKECVLMAKNKSRMEIASSLSKSEFENFSFGIQQKDEPEKLFQARCQYRNANKITKGSVDVIHCGDLKWYNEPGLTIDQIERRFSSTEIPVRADGTNAERVQFDGKELQLAVREEMRKRGELKLVRIQINADDSQEASIEYFMLISVDNNLNWDDPEVKTFFTQTYLSNTYRNLATKATKTGECLYGGRIVRNSNGKMEVRFLHDEIKGAEKANKTVGTTVTSGGKRKRQRLKKMIAGIRNDLADRTLRNAFGEPLEEGER